MFKLSVFVDIPNGEKVKEAIFAAGGGAIGNYRHCSFETIGVGQFMPLSGASPFLGETGKLTRVAEMKIEVVLEDDKIEDVIRAMKKAHPYETPAYDVVKLANY